MKVLVLNCGSSSIKYKLFDMDHKEVIAQGGIEKIGLKGSFLKLTLPDGGKKILEKDIPEHTVGVEFILNTLISPEYGAIKSLDEINAVGHRMVHGGERFSESVLLNKEVLEENKKAILERFGTIDVLLNAAGGNMPGATIAPDKTVLDLDVDAFRKVVDLNLFGTVLPTMVFVDVMAKNKKGAIVNFCSESALRPLTRVVGYGSAKAAIGNYTRYMATELATKFSPELRVNAIVPGFLLTNQNRALLTNPDGSYTDRAKTIIAHTPCGRFAEPEELFGTIHYLISDASSFVTGALSVVDGGFDAFSI